MKSRDLETAETVAQPGPDAASNTVPVTNDEWPDAAQIAIPQVSGYEIEQEIGRGGMGIVYRARQTGLGRTVALKMILSADAEGEARTRFLREAEAVASLKHPNIVQIHEFGEVEGRPYFSLEFVEGGSLEDLLDEGPLDWRRATSLLATLARAVAAAHAHGIVHRDLKPENVLMTESGVPKVTDFGIAKRLGGDKQTQTGKILGTPCYMAPEQALGRIDQVSAGTDIYALGAILYDMLTGRPPFQGNSTIDTIMQTVVREPVPPRLLQPSVPRDLEIVCLKCLEKTPAKRYASAIELADDLDRVSRGEPIHARPVSTIEQARRWARQRPVRATLIAATVVGTCGLLAAGAWFTRQLQQELARTELARQDATQARNELRQRLVHSTADGIDSDLRQLAGVPRVLARALEGRRDWSEAQLGAWLRSELVAEPLIFGMAVAFEPHEFEDGVQDFCLYAYRHGRGLKTKQLLPPSYTPIYRKWQWYEKASAMGAWSEPYVDEGGGGIPMVTYSIPIQRGGRKAGVVTVDLSLEYFRSLERRVRESALGESSTAFVVTPSGNILGHQERRFRFPSPTAQNPWKAHEGQTEVWSRVLGGETGHADGIDFATGNTIELLFAPIEATGWASVAVVPK